MKTQFASEYDIHCTICDWIRLQEQAHPLLKMCWHTPNGGLRRISTAQKLKRMLVRPGIPDLILPLPQGGYMGLAMEIKGPHGRTTKEQASVLARLSMYGWRCEIVSDVDRGINILEEYIGL